MHLNIDWKNWLNRLLWSLIFSFPLGILGSYIAGTISDDTPRLLIFSKSSSLGGQTVIDLKVRNAGDFDLKGLKVILEFENRPTLSTLPTEFEQYAFLDKTKCTFSLPTNIEFKKGQLIEFRFVSEGSNRILNYNSLPKSISSNLFVSKIVYASWQNDTLFKSLEFKDIIIASTLIVMIIVICALVSE